MKWISTIILLYISFSESIMKCSQRLGEGNSCQVSFKSSRTIEITSDFYISSIYIHYKKTNQGILLTGTSSIAIGNHGYRHEFVPLPSCSKVVTIKYSSFPEINKIYCFNATPPQWVERWEPPARKVDLMIVSAHDDDTHLYFAGLIPTVKSAGYSVQVVYTISHDNNPPRYDEVLASLWISGVRHYPIFGIVPDKFSTTLEQAITNMEESNMTLHDLITFHITNIRRFRPAVIVTHDEQGEYGHGQHRLTSYSVRESLKYLNDTHIKSSDPIFHPYKLYLHLYPRNRIQMNYDIPLQLYGGLTAYQVSRLAFDQHVSQHSVYLTRWFGGENQTFRRATEIQTFSPCNFGLYMSMVGYNDSEANIFSNIPIPTLNVNTKSTPPLIPDCTRVKSPSGFHEKPIYQMLLFSIFGLIFLYCIIRKIDHLKRCISRWHHPCILS